MSRRIRPLFLIVVLLLLTAPVLAQDEPVTIQWLACGCWGGDVNAVAADFMAANPDINVVIPIYDSMSQFVVPAMRLTGKAGQVKVATFNGTPFVLDYIAQGVVDMNIGESLDWIAYATVDGHLRDACGMQSPKALNVPFYIFDKNNVADAGTPAKFDTGYGDAYVAGFRKLWGLDK